MHACTHPTHCMYTASGVGVFLQPSLSELLVHTHTHAHMHAYMNADDGVIV